MASSHDMSNDPNASSSPDQGPEDQWSTAVTTGSPDQVADLHELVENDDGWSEQAVEGEHFLSELVQEGVLIAVEQPFDDVLAYKCIKCETWFNGPGQVTYHLFTKKHSRNHQ